jgi:hypothetical protein
MLLNAGEVAAVDLTRAQLQTLTRRDELERARVNERSRRLDLCECWLALILRGR